MLNYNLPLTEAESEFAAEHHSVIYGYLRKAGLPEDDFYDVVVFGYLRAVRKYLARPELRKYSFSTIAYRAMSCDVHHSKEYWMRKKRRALVESLDEELHTRDLEIARMFQVKPGEIKLEMDQARSKVVPFPTETAALAA